MPLAEELEAAGRPIDRMLDERQEEIKAQFTEKRGYWNPFWDDLLVLDGEFLAAYTEVLVGSVGQRDARAQDQGVHLHRV